MKRMNKKVSELVSDLTIYMRRYDDYVAKMKYHPDGLTAIEQAEKSVAFYNMEIIRQRLFLEHGIAENSLVHNKTDIKKYYGEFHTIHDIYNYEELESAKTWLKICKSDLMDILAKSKAAA